MHIPAFLTLLLLNACAATSGQDASLLNSTWKFTAIDGAVPVSQRAQVAFQRGRIGVNVGCNSMGGAWRIEGHRLIAGPLIQTEMFCEGPVWAQEQTVSALLAGTPEFSVTGERMTLRAGGHSAELARMAR